MASKDAKKRKAIHAPAEVDISNKKPKKLSADAPSASMNKVKKSKGHSHTASKPAFSTTNAPARPTSKDTTLTSKTSRKRAVDFLSDASDVSEPEETVSKSTKSKPSNSAVLSKSDIAEKPKKSRKIKIMKDETDGTTKDAMVAASADKAKKKKAFTTANSRPDKIEELVSSHYSKWPETELEKRALKKLVKEPLATFEEDDATSDPDNDENFPNTQANPPTSLRAEAIRTVDQEMVDEYGNDSDFSDDGGANVELESSDAESEADNEVGNNTIPWDVTNNHDLPVDDNAAQLLAGFDSDSEDTAQTRPIDPSKLASLPEPVGKKTKNKLRKAAEQDDDTPGTIFVGRIPHGFYEHQMRAYFSQFGAIKRLRLSRNRQTGASKHYAFIEFQSAEVAKIVAATMDNYLMFGHILKCKYAPPETLHADVWKGANRRFRKIPYNKLEKRALEAPKTEAQWDKKAEKEQQKREAKAAMLKEKMGYHFELPELKKAGDVLAQQSLEDATGFEPIQDTAKPSGPEETSKNSKKDNRKAIQGKPESTVEIVTQTLKKSKGEHMTEPSNDGVEPERKKRQRSRKGKSQAVPDTGPGSLALTEGQDARSFEKTSITPGSKDTEDSHNKKKGKSKKRNVDRETRAGKSAKKIRV